MTMTEMPVLQQIWAKAKADIKDAVKDESGQAALVIITIVIVAAGVAISQMSVQNNRRSLEVTQSQRANFDKITNAIDVYAIQDTGAGGNTFYVPCPANAADGDGLAEAYVGGTSCTGQNRGIVPWATLGLTEADVIDVNGNYITYIVDRTSISACNGASPTPVSLTNQGLTAPAADANYALISHGANGFTAFNSNSNNQVSVANASARELENCPSLAGGCVGVAPDDYRSGPPDDTLGATFFDDVVRGVSFAETFTEECLVLSEPPDPETATILDTSSQPSYSEQQLQQNATRTDDANTNFADVSVTLDNQGTADDLSDDTRLIRFADRKAAEATAACIFFDQPFPIIDHKVRILADFTARNDTGDSRGGGTVMTFMSYDPDVDPTIVDPLLDGRGTDSGYVISPTICGGTNTHMGFSDDESIAARQLPGVPRFGIEIDTRAETGTIGEGTNTNQDSTVVFGDTAAAWNHVAIIGSNNDHMGTDQTDTGDLGDDDPTPADDASIRGDGSVCISGIGGLNAVGGTGCATEANVSITSPVVGDVGFIEVGESTPADGDFHQMRVELVYEGGTCTQDQVQVQYWLYLSDGDTNGSCDADVATCSDLTVDMDVGEVNPTTITKSACVPWKGHFNDEFMRIGFTSGQPAGAASILDQFTIRRFDVFAIGIAKPAAGVTAPAGTQSREIHNVNVSDEVVRVVQPGGIDTFDSDMGLIDIDDVTQSNFVDDRVDTGVRLISRNGTLDVQLDGGGLPDPLTDTNGIGIRGFGSEATNELDMFWVRTTVAVPDDLGIHPSANNPELREALEVRFYADNDDETGAGTSTTTSYERVSLNLGRFTSKANTTPGDTRPEEVIVRAFSGGSFLGEQTITSCNTGTTSGTVNMFLSLDYSANPVDRLIIIPDILTTVGDPAAYPDDEFGSDFYIRGIKGCSGERSCGLTATSDCTTYQNLASYPHGGLGDPTTAFDIGDMSGLITLDNLQTQFVGSSGVALIGTAGSSDTSWQNLERDFSAGLANAADSGPVYVDIIPSNGLLRFNEDTDPGEDYNEGMWVGGGRIQSSASESLDFRWANDWNTALISIGHFGQVGSNADPTGRYERVEVIGYSDGAEVARTTVESCADTDTHGELGATADNTATANFIFNWAPGVTIDRIEVIPTQTLLGAATEFVINGIRMCTEAAGCTGTDFGSLDGTESCSMTFSVP